MSLQQAIWFPFWYELDQSLELGKTGNFLFFREPPSTLPGVTVPVFYCGDLRLTDSCYSAEKRILQINHPILGQIERIDAKGLCYTLRMTDGRELKVQAEESPGQIINSGLRVADCRIYVEIEQV